MLPALLLALVLTLSPAGAVTVYGYQEGLAKAEENGLWGFADASGRVVIPIRYQSVLDFTLGTALVRTNNKMARPGSRPETSWGSSARTGPTSWSRCTTPWRTWATASIWPSKGTPGAW